MGQIDACMCILDLYTYIHAWEQYQSAVAEGFSMFIVSE